MSRFALFGGLLLALAARGATAAEDKKDVPKDLVPFQGTWHVIESAVGDPAAPKEPRPGKFLTFEHDALTVTEKDRTESGTYAVDAHRTPATIDIISAKGDKAPGIYKFNKDGLLTLVLAPTKGAARPKTFDEKEVIVLVLERVKK